MSNFKQHIKYWILPSIVVGLCMCVYFFDILGLSFLIAPEYNREFGLIENIQLLIILAIIVLAYKNSKKAKFKPIRLLFILILIGSVFIFLEEIDYGLHYYEYLIGKSPEQISIDSSKNSIRNIHNQGSLTKYIKLSAYILLIIMIVLPILFRKLKFKTKYLDYLAPTHYFIYTLLSMVALNQAALYMDKFLKSTEIKSLNSNVSEFEEVFIYYIIFLYILEKSSLLLSFGNDEVRGENTTI